MKKNNSRTKRTYKKKFKINNYISKLDKPIIITIGIILALIIIGSITLGTKLTIILSIGIALIFGIARLLDKVKSKSKRRKILNIILIFIFSFAILICLLAVGFITMVVIKAPEFDISQLTKKEASIIYDKNGEEIARLGSQLRENITYDDLPEVFIDALIATEDSRFFQHNGFDAPRFIKATIGQLLGKKNAGGASTLSMQLIKNTYTGFEDEGIKGIMRKFTDIYLSVFKLEKNFTKQEIIEYYVNNYDLSSNSWGVEQASQTYFGKSVKDLNLSEAALLVGMFNAPTTYNPFNNPLNAYNRRYTVLNLMVRHGYITKEEADAANAIPITSLLANKTKTLDYQGYIDTVIYELKDKHHIDPYTTPVLIYTNMDKEKQQGLDDIFNGKGSYKWVNDTVESGVAVVEAKTGKVVAIGAGRNKTSPLTWNTATQELRQIGSTAKPIFDYGPAVEYLNWSTYQQIIDEPWSYSTGQAINNSDRTFMGQISMRTALSQSRNIPALKAFQEVQAKVGNKKIKEFAENLGIKPQEDGNGGIYEAHSLGAFDGTSPLQMAAAYAAFANGGTYIEPLTVNKVVFRENNDVKTFKGKETKAMSEATAFMVTDMLVTAVNSGLSSGAKISNVTLAAKTGTSNFSNETKKLYRLSDDAINDAWIVGYDPEYSVSMWYGYRTVSSKTYNKQIPAVVQRGKLYQAIGNVIFNKNNQTFKAPNSVVKVCVENGSNPPSLPSTNTPQDQIACEYFKTGTEPTETSSKYNRLTTVSNLKAAYDENTKKVTISWSKLNAPTGNNDFGEFGYNVYYGDILLGFTTDNYYTVDASSSISGVYKVVTTFEKYSANQSNPATYNLRYEDPNADNSVYSLTLNGNNPVSITATSNYRDSDIPVQLLRNGTPINNEVNLNSILNIVIKDPSGKVISSISGSTSSPLATGTYTITYTVTYKEKTYSKVRQVIVT